MRGFLFAHRCMQTFLPASVAPVCTQKIRMLLTFSHRSYVDDMHARRVAQTVRSACSFARRAAQIVHAHNRSLDCTSKTSLLFKVLHVWFCWYSPILYKLCQCCWCQVALGQHHSSQMTSAVRSTHAACSAGSDNRHTDTQCPTQ
jgi:hypothetical protein